MRTCKIQYDNLITESQEDGDVLIKYNNILIGKIEEGSTGTSIATLPCNGKRMAGDLIIGSGTLPCKGKMMNSDIVITINKSDND